MFFQEKRLSLDGQSLVRKIKPSFKALVLIVAIGPRGWESFMAAVKVSRSPTRTL